MIDNIVFVFMWWLNLDASAVNTANHPRKPPLGKKYRVRFEVSPLRSMAT